MADDVDTARSQRSISPTATAQAVYSRSTPRLAASSAWNASDCARKRRNDSTRSHRPDPWGVRTLSSQPRIAAAKPAPASTAPTTTSGSHSSPQRHDSAPPTPSPRSEEHTSALQSLMRISYAVFYSTHTRDTTHTLTQYSNTTTQT